MTTPKQMDIFEYPQMMRILTVLIKKKMTVTGVMKSITTKYGTYPAYNSILLNIRDIEVMELCSTTKIGRERFVTLTPKGELIARLLKKVKGNLNGDADRS